MAGIPTWFVEWLVFIVILIVLGLWFSFAMRRRMKAKRLIIWKDMRNPNAPAQKYFAVYDKKADYIRLYGNLFKPWQDAIIPPFNMASYLVDGRIYALRGVTGNPDDNNIIPVHYTLVGKAGAGAFAEELGGAVVNTLGFFEDCKRFRIGELVAYTHTKQAGKEEQKTEVPGMIDSIDYDGIHFKYYNYMYDKDRKPIYDDNGQQKLEEKFIVLADSVELGKLKSQMTDEQKKKLPLPRYEDFFNATWVMNNFGIVPVDDANAVLESQKSAVAQFNSKVNERIMNRSSWLTRNASNVILVVMVFVIVLCNILLWYALTQDATQLFNQARGASTITTNGISVLPNPS